MISSPGDLPFQLLLEWGKSLVYGCQHLIPGLMFLLKFLVYLFFEENLFQ